MADAHKEYTNRHAVRKESAAAAERRADRIADARLLLFLAAIALGVAAWYLPWLSLYALAIPVVLFLALVIYHDRVHRERERATAATDFYTRGLDRINGRWAGKADDGLRFQPDHHPYAADLDVFGMGSLFELICTARTQKGAQTLANWLLTPAPPEVVATRQEAVEELRHALDLREELGVLGAGFDREVRPEALEAWAKAAPDLVISPVMARTAPVLTALGVAGVTLSFLIGGIAPAVLVLILCLAAHGPYRYALPRLSAGVSAASQELNMLARVLRVLESAEFQAPGLKALQQRLTAQEGRASDAIAHLDRLVTLYDLQRNQMFLPFAILLLWGIHAGRRIENWRASHRDVLCNDWLPAVGELEALCALSGYAYEHPEDVFPEYTQDGPRIELQAAAHPLLPAAKAVRNDTALTPDARALIVSGSNMSGKSTLLRTVGLNLVLAQAGAPVRARAMTCSPLALGATMRVQDSIQEGASRFYAEIQRFRQILDLANAGPMLFLADEILHGTNSHDRCIGAAGLLTALLERGAIGMITTHDLAITALADDHPGTGNVHLQDDLKGGKLAFDYKVRPGVVQKSNALDLMRQVGLPV
jgi:hypothetical protein